MPENKPPFVIHIDGKQFKVDQTSMTGAQLKALAGKDSTYQLFQELQGSEPDNQIADSQAVQMSNGLHFYTLPVTTLGA